MMSIGLPWLQVGGRTASSAAIVSGASSASLPPPLMSVSVARTPGPPALLSTVRRGPRGQGLLAEDLGEVEEVRDPLGAQDADAPERRVEDLVAAGQRPGMGRRGSRRLRGAARLHDDDRLRQRDLARRREEGARVADGLHVQDDRVGLGVVAEVVDEVAPADVGHRAERHDAAEADALTQAPVEDRRDERAALADERHPSSPGQRRREGRVQAGHGAHDPEAVRSDEPDVVGACLVDEGSLERGSLGADLLEARRDDDDAPDPGAAALGDEVGDRRRRRHDDRELDLFGDVAHARMGRDAEDGRRAGFTG